MNTSYLNDYFDEDRLPPDQPPILTQGVESVRMIIELLLASKAKTGYGRMAVIVGPSGIGKSVALQTVLNEISMRSPRGLPICLKIKAKSDSTPRQLVEDIVIGLGEKPRAFNTNRFRLADQAAEVILANGLRLLVIDDADELDAPCYNFLRYLFAKTGCAILVVGLKPILSVIRKQAKFKNRLGLQLDFPELSEAEVLTTFLPQLTLPYWTFDPTSEEDQQLGRKLWASVKPELRSLRAILQNASDLVEQSGEQRVTPNLVTMGFHLTPLGHRPGGLGSEEPEPEEQETSPEEQTEYEQESKRRQEGKGKKPRGEK